MAERRSPGTRASAPRHPPSHPPALELKFDPADRLPLGQWVICVRAVIERGQVPDQPSLPIGPHRTYSISPSSVTASGAIIIVPPVNLLLLNVKNNERRRSNSLRSSNRTGNGADQPRQAKKNRQEIAKLPRP